MTGRGSGNPRPALLLVLLCLAMLTAGAASADDPQTLALLPGLWSTTDPVEGEDGVTREVTLDLAFHENGRLDLRCDSGDGGARTVEATWAFDAVADGVDRLTCVFPQSDGQDGPVTSVYGVYTESWVAEDTAVTALILEPVESDGVSPLAALYDWDGVSVYRRQGPNMQVVNCQSFVSLRERPDTGARRLAKVPLGEKVLAWPQTGAEKGFILCCWHDTWGYILAEYLSPVQP